MLLFWNVLSCILLQTTGKRLLSAARMKLWGRAGRVA